MRKINFKELLFKQKELFYRIKYFEDLILKSNDPIKEIYDRTLFNIKIFTNDFLDNNFKKALKIYGYDNDIKILTKKLLVKIDKEMTYFQLYENIKLKDSTLNIIKKILKKSNNIISFNDFINNISFIINFFSYNFILFNKNREDLTFNIIFRYIIKGENEIKEDLLEIIKNNYYNLDKDDFFLNEYSLFIIFAINRNKNYFNEIKSSLLRRNKRICKILLNKKNVFNDKDEKENIIQKIYNMSPSWLDGLFKSIILYLIDSKNIDIFRICYELLDSNQFQYDNFITYFFKGKNFASYNGESIIEITDEEKYFLNYEKIFNYFNLEEKIDIFLNQLVEYFFGKEYLFLLKNKDIVNNIKTLIKLYIISEQESSSYLPSKLLRAKNLFEEKYREPIIESLVTAIIKSPIKDKLLLVHNIYIENIFPNFIEKLEKVLDEDFYKLEQGKKLNHFNYFFNFIKYNFFELNIFIFPNISLRKKLFELINFLAKKMKKINQLNWKIDNDFIKTIFNNIIKNKEKINLFLDIFNGKLINEKMSTEETLFFRNNIVVNEIDQIIFLFNFLSKILNKKDIETFNNFIEIIIKINYTDFFFEKKNNYRIFYETIDALININLYELFRKNKDNKIRFYFFFKFLEKIIQYNNNKKLTKKLYKVLNKIKNKKIFYPNLLIAYNLKKSYYENFYYILLLLFLLDREPIFEEINISISETEKKKMIYILNKLILYFVIERKIEFKEINSILENFIFSSEKEKDVKLKFIFEESIRKTILEIMYLDLE